MSKIIGEKIKYAVKKTGIIGNNNNTNISSDNARLELIEEKIKRHEIEIKLLEEKIKFLEGKKK